MRLFPVCRVGLLLLFIGAVLGCDAANEQKPSTRSSAVNAKELPELDDYFPPLDDGGIEVAPPKGWHLPPRSNKYVFRAQKSDQDNYPSILITAEDYDAAGISNVSKENVEQFAARVAEAVGKDKSEVSRIELGTFVGAAYRKRAKVRTPVTRILELLRLETVAAGRKYCLELRSEDGFLKQDQAYLFAVAQGIKFLKAGSPDQSSLEDEPSERPKASEAEAGPEDEAKGGSEDEPEEKPKEKPDDKPRDKSKAGADEPVNKQPEEPAKAEPKEESENQPKKSKKGKDELDLDGLLNDVLQ